MDRPHGFAQTVGDGVEVADVAPSLRPAATRRSAGARLRRRCDSTSRRATACGRVDVGQLPLRRRGGLGRRERRFGESISAFNAARRASRSPWSARPRSRAASNGASGSFGPLLESSGDVVGSRGLLVAPHPKGPELQQRRTLPARPCGRLTAPNTATTSFPSHGPAAIPYPAARSASRSQAYCSRDGVESPYGCSRPRRSPGAATPPPGWPPRGSRLRWSPRRRRTPPPPAPHPEPTGQRQPAGDREHGAKVADHAHDVVFGNAEVERPVAAYGEPSSRPSNWRRSVEIDPPPGEDPDVPVQGKDPVVGAESGGDEEIAS